MKKDNTYVIVGNSAAGLSAIESIRRVDKSSNIINISREPHRPYSRCLLSYYLAGQYDKDILWIRPEDYYKKYDVEPLLNTAVEKVDSKKKIIAVDGKKIDFDKLLIATGASAKSIKINGSDKKGVFVLRTLEDAAGILNMLPHVKKACVLGGGLIGMRAAYALKKRGVKVHVIVKSTHIFSQMLDSEAADMMRQHLESNGIEISTGLEAKEISGKDSVNGILLDDGNSIDCELVIIGKGVSANMEMAKGEVKANIGIVADEHLQTDNKDIYAAGDVAETYDILEGANSVNQIWPAAIRQGKIAGLNMAGEEARYEGSYGTNSLDFFDLAVMSFGVVHPVRKIFSNGVKAKSDVRLRQGYGGLSSEALAKEDEFEELIEMDTTRRLYRKIVLKGKRIVGGVLINDVERHGILLNLALQKIDISDIKDILADEYFDFGKVIPLVKRQGKCFVRSEYKDALSTYGGL